MGMTIDEAIELLNTAKEGFPASDTERYYKAMELGIEALRGIKKVRKTFRPYVEALLPGEIEFPAGGKE